VQFNTAYNTSMAYMAHHYSDISLERTDGNQLLIQLKAPLNFHQDKIDTVAVQLCHENGKCIPIQLVESDPYSEFLSARVSLSGDVLRYDGKEIRLQKGNTLSVSYGYGFFMKEAELKWVW